MEITFPKQLKISIIILTKNNGSTIGNVLKQIKSQQINDPYEIIIVDSGSSDDTVRQMLIIDNTIDVKYFRPSDELIKQATKIDRPKDAPMQFFCSTCHKPHGQLRPDDIGTCLSCHPNEDKVGKHKIHIEDAELQCTHCHKPHSWRVTKKLSKTLCSECHEYRDPGTFLGDGK